MPVEVVGRQVEPERGVGAELFRPRQAEAAALDDVRVELHLERVDERNVGVAGRDRAHARGGQHRRREQARGRLAVGPGDGEDRSGPAGSVLLPLVGELDLAAHRHVVASRGDDHGVRLGHTRRRRHEIEAGDESVDRDRCREQLDAELVGQVALGVVDVVVDDDDFVAAPGECAHRRCTGHREAVDERAHDHSAAIRVKSPMKTASADATQIALISQNRMITVVSGHPRSSKWWCTGDMRNSRRVRPDALNTPI